MGFHDKIFSLNRIPERFDQGLFFGNGTFGALLYCEKDALHFSLDHQGLWETRDTQEDRPRAMFRQYAENPEGFLSYDPAVVMPTNSFDSEIGRTRLPGLTAVLRLPAEIVSFEAETDLLRAESRIHLVLADGSRIKCTAYLSSCANRFCLTLEGNGAERLPLELRGWNLENPALWPMKGWGYPEAFRLGDKEAEHLLQPFSGNGLAALSVLAQPGEGTLAAAIALNVDVVSRQDLLLEENRKLLREWKAEKDACLSAHRAAWAAYWDQCDVCVPSRRLQEAFDLERYKIFCNEREDNLPVTLQGVWNPDDRMPAWTGDLHNDLNVQACYWPSYKTNNVKAVKAYISYYAKSCMPRLEERAEKLFGIKNAVHVPVMMAPEGYGASAEWCYWNMLPGPELFVSTDFCWYYEFSRDLDMLKAEIYPFLEKVANLYAGICCEGDDGCLHIPFTNSPEVDRDGKSVCADDGTFALSALHYLLAKLERYAGLLGQDAGHWKGFRERLVPLTMGERGYPLFPGEEVFKSHRHFTHLYPLFPLGTDMHSETAQKSLDAVIDMGFTEFASFSFPYLSIMASRCGRGNMARTMLEIYAMSFRTRSGFAVNGDANRSGIFRVSEESAGESAETVTLEAGFMFAAALCEMFVHRGGDTVHIAAGIPKDWESCSCRDLTIEGGHRITLDYSGWRLRHVRIDPGCDEELSLVFHGAEPRSISVSLHAGKEAAFVF